MPEPETVERAERDKEQGKSASTQAGEFVREEMHHVREGKHGARSPQQAIAIEIGNGGKSRTRQRTRKIGVDAGRRVCARRNASCARRETRSQVAAASHCNRTIESAPRGREAGCAKGWPRQRENPPPGKTRFGQGTIQAQKGFAEAVARNFWRVEKGK